MAISSKGNVSPQAELGWGRSTKRDGVSRSKLNLSALKLILELNDKKIIIIVRNTVKNFNKVLSV